MGDYALELGEGDRGEHRFFRGRKFKADRRRGVGPLFEEDVFERGVHRGLFYEYLQAAGNMAVDYFT
jgi:hypothetical protein